MKSFASDNNSGAHPDILKAILAANEGHTLAYGDDPFTQAALRRVKTNFGEEAQAYFVFGGTGANVLGLKQLTQPFQAVVCAESAHIHNDECGAPEHFTGCKLLTLPTPDGKITREGIQSQLHGIGFEHHVQPRVVSITQPTELGTIYSLEEMKILADFVHERGMLLHVDGARLANAAAFLGATLRRNTAEIPVDVLSFGGTKNGLMYGECVIFFRRDLAEHFQYIRKQGMQLASKMRFIAAQFDAYLTDELWLKNAEHANAMAQRLAEAIRKIPRIRITQEVQSNAVFAVVPPPLIEELQEKYFFYVWNEAISEVRWMTSYDTTPDDVDQFAEWISHVMRNRE